MVVLETLLLVCALGAAPDDTVLLDFSSPYCGPCRAMEPTIRRLASDGYPVRQIDTTQQPELAARFRVTSLPCLVMIAGGREVERTVGATGYSELVGMFTRAGFRPEVAATAQAPAETFRGQSPDARLGERLRDRVGEMFSGRHGHEPAPQQPAVDTPPPLDERRISNTTSTTDLRTSAGTDRSPQERALRATVRLTVETEKYKDIATGTIIDTHGDEALVVTCGHVFRDSAGKGRIRVEFCGLPGASAVAGQLIAYDAARCDIGLVAIRPGIAVEPVQVAPGGHPVHERMAVFSVGCDNGGPASVVESRVSGINRYLGPPNIEVSGAPTEGRSGGGLFSADGLLIGICNAADKTDNEGLYGALSTIHEQLAQIGLERVFQRTALESPREMGSQQMLGSREPAVPALPATMPGQSFADRQLASGMASGDNVELIFIVRPRDGGAGRSEAMVIDNPSQELLQMVNRESQRATTTNVAREAPPTAFPSRSESGPIVRGQSIP